MCFRTPDPKSGAYTKFGYVRMSRRLGVVEFASNLGSGRRSVTVSSGAAGDGVLLGVGRQGLEP
mgnify:CR=1 FL=1